MKEEQNIVCPVCGSDDVYKEKVPATAIAISLLLLGMPLPFMKRKYHCFECGHDFVPKKDGREST